VGHDHKAGMDGAPKMMGGPPGGKETGLCPASVHLSWIYVESNHARHYNFAKSASQIK